MLFPDYSPLSHVLVLAALVLVCLAATLFLLFISARKVFGRRMVLGMTTGVGALLLLSVALVSALLLSNLYIYQRLTSEQRIATLSFERVADQHYRVKVTEENARAREFDLRGDEWQLDAQIVKWKGMAVLLGLDTLYRLVRIQGRYHDIGDERRKPRSVYPLAEERNYDLWSLKKDYELPQLWVDAIYGSSTFLPLVDNGKYAVFVTASGLIARPLNAASRTAVQRW